MHRSGKWFRLDRTQKPSQLSMLFQVNVAASSNVNTAAGRNAMVTSLIICCGFIACWSLNEITYFLSIIRVYQIDFSGWFYHFTAVLVYLNSCINPFIYAAKYREFQTGVRRMLQKIRSRAQVSSVSGS